MNQFVYDDQAFENVVYSEQTISGKEFQSCVFKQCDFSNSIFLNNKFLDCTFQDCNLSLMKLGGTTLSSAVFKNCKILGVLFTECQEFLFSVAFHSCILDYSSFMGRKMVKTRFLKTSLKEVNFTGSNLTGSAFDDCNLLDTLFNQTDLSSVNFTTAHNFIIDPELNVMKKAIFSAEGLPGLLTKYQIKIV